MLQLQNYLLMQTSTALREEAQLLNKDFCQSLFLIFFFIFLIYLDFFWYYKGKINNNLKNIISKLYHVRTYTLKAYNLLQNFDKKDT